MKKKEKFFKFEEEVYNPETGKFVINNLKEESERLTNYINERTSAIEDEDDLDKKTYLTQDYLKDSKSLEKEITEKKSELTKKHIKDLADELTQLSKLIKEIQEEVKGHTSEALINAGRADVFYTAPAYEIRTTPITDVDKLQMAITFLNQLGIETKIYKDGKVLKPEEKVMGKGDKEKTPEFSDKDDGMTMC